MTAVLLVACGETSGDPGNSTGTGGDLASGTGATATGGARPEAGASTGGASAETGGRVTGGSDPGGTGGTGGSEPGGSGGTGGGATGGTGATGGSETGGTTTGGSEPGGADTGGATTGEGGSGSLVGLAFDIQVPLDENDYDWCAGPCEPATLLITGASDDRLDAVWGSTARAQTLALTPSGSGWTLSDPIVLGTERTWEYAMCANGSNLGPGTFEFADTNGDGGLDLSITAEQNSRYCSDDYSTTSTGEVVLTGVPDDRAPEADVGVTLLRGASIDIDKPLVGTATCTLVPEGTGDRVPLVPRVMEGYVVGFDTAVTLPLGVQYTTEFAGADFAGVGTPADIVVATNDDFGVLTDGGFESGSTDGVRGGAIVDSYGVTAINGQHMLQAGAGEAVALHLQRAGDEQSLVLDGHVLDYCGYGGYGTLSIAVAVVGNDTTEVGTLTVGEGTDVAVDNWNLTVGELHHLVIPLPGVGTDVLVSFQGASYAGAGCNRVGALMDDVHLE
jgi:hypothetical protein